MSLRQGADTYTTKCRICENDTKHYVSNSNCVPCARTRKRKRERTTGKACPIHPTCRTRQFGTCIRCKQLSDITKLRKKYFNISFVRSLEGQLCYLCNEPVFTNVVAHHPTTMTLHRICPGKMGGEYTKENTTVCHFQCNTAMGTRTRQDTKLLLERIYYFQCNHVYKLSVVPLLKVGGKNLYKRLVSQKRSDAKRDKKQFTLDYKWMMDQLHRQGGQCWICGDYLQKDISFDQCPPGSGYHKHTTRLAHSQCNSAKFTSMENLLRIAKLVVGDDTNKT